MRVRQYPTCFPGCVAHYHPQQSFTLMYANPLFLSGGDTHGDPHIKGFDGSWYEFPGKTGKIFNILTERRFQVCSAPANYKANAALCSKAVLPIGHQQSYQLLRSSVAVLLDTRYRCSCVCPMDSHTATNWSHTFTPVLLPPGECAIRGATRTAQPHRQGGKLPDAGGSVSRGNAHLGEGARRGQDQRCALPLRLDSDRF